VWLPPDTLDLMVQGYTETLDQYTWEITYNCTPYSPWNISHTDDDTYGKADTAGSELTEALTTGETDVDVLTTSGPVWTTDDTEFPFDVRAGGEVWSVTDITSAAEDDFSDTVSNGWGAADIGGSWTTSGGIASDYAVGSGYGSHTLTSVNVARFTTLTAAAADCDITCDIATDALATGASIQGSLVARMTDASNLYMARLSFTPSPTNGIDMSLRKIVSGSETLLTSYTTGFTHVAGTFYRLRLQLDGTSLRMKLWQLTAWEPSGWQLETTDSALTAAGSYGCRSMAATGNTNVNPAVRYDNFEVVNPQTFTVTRSVNGVVKTHTAGTSVRLAYPAIVAL